MLYKRGRTWWGRTQRQNRDLRRSLKTRDKKIAEKRYRTWIEELDGMAWGEKPARTFDEVARRFATEHLTRLKPSSADRYEYSIDRLSETFVNMPLNKITSAALAAFEARRREKGIIIRNKRREVTSASIRRDLACLSSMLTSAEEWEWINRGSNPVPAYLKGRAKRGLKESPPRTRYLTENEERKLLQHATPAVRNAIILSIDTGLRREELFSLKWRQVDMARGVIITTTKTKSGRARMVPISERAAQILAQLQASKRSDYVLSHETGERLLQMNKGFKAAIRRAAIADARWHDLRRTTGCRWLQRDRRSMAEVSGLLGHSSISVTENHYAFMDLESVAEAMGTRTKTDTRTADSDKEPIQPQ